MAYILLTTERVPEVDLYLDGSEMSTTTDQTLQPITTKFGPLTETYTDKYGFSLNYPKEMNVYNQNKSCILSVGIPPQRFGFRMDIFGPDCNPRVSGANPEAKNLKDYEKNYLITIQTGDPTVEAWVGIESSQKITTINNTVGLEQGYYSKSVNPLTKEEQNKYGMRDVIKRYVFVSPSSQSYILVRSGEGEDRPEFRELEKKIINSIKFR
jgi:hypothetical protein